MAVNLGGSLQHQPERIHLIFTDPMTANADETQALGPLCWVGDSLISILQPEKGATTAVMNLFMTMLLFIGTLPTWADPNGDAWLAKIDRTARVSAAHLILDVTVTDARGKQKPRTIEIWQKGDEQRLVRMIAPARLAGIGLLASPGGTLHLFLPNYPPARRVVGSKRSDAFMGTDFAIEDLSRMTFADDYTATVAEQIGRETHLVLTSKKDIKEPAFHVWVDSSAVVRKIEHINSSGQTNRRLVLDDVRTIRGTPIPHYMRVNDLARNRTTEARIRRIQIGIDVDDDMFSVAQLERP